MVKALSGVFGEERGKRSNLLCDVHVSCLLLLLFSLGLELLGFSIDTNWEKGILLPILYSMDVDDLPIAVSQVYI